ncbi:MAG: HD domain-containing protein [Sarcina sp.]
MFYRIKQFLWAISSNFKEIDTDYINSILSNEEQKLFYSLIKSEQFHCLRVTHDLINSFADDSDINKNELAKLGLLHDVGKQGLKFGPINKSIFVIFKKISKGNIKKYNKLKKMNLYYNHPIKGVNILRESKFNSYSENFLEAIEMHHSNQQSISKSKNKYLIYLNICDDRN